ncbi:uncharacterized protein EI90DRAFT_3077001 [Cantharellus anzutake]|uniref:uncharacterized protein n=1 Tax=Cantharellus anzutake TaxID=1750568 RepID=UPI001904BB96|nr:uncharacterized protein EI90DRAFT_3077001 [Cantharellus anzutake]KAF8323550.1 hypothetical protein EI90DRAFT_3077001 [Cantharellus anzutake]
MNATLQCLSSTVPFVRIFQVAVNTINPMGSKGLIAQAFSSIIRDMWRSEYTYLSPTHFRTHICQRGVQFAGTNQHDAQEFLSFLLDGLHEDLNRVLARPEPRALTIEREAELEHLPHQIASAQEWTFYLSRNDSIVVDYFQGQFRNRLQCLTCRKTSITFNAFMYLSLPIPTRGEKASLSQCLDTFVGEEIMEKSNAWNCPHCKVLRKASKQLSLSRLPPVLLIHLKRFSFNGPFTDKVETQVDFPVRGLDLTRYMPQSTTAVVSSMKSQSKTDPRTQDPPFMYDLYGVINHFGNLSSGHYTAHIASNGRWLYCDDSRIMEVPTANVVGRPAYILFYKRRTS